MASAGDESKLAPAVFPHHRAPVFAGVEHFIARAADLRPGQQPINFEHNFPAQNVSLERADGVQLALTLAFAQFEAVAERNRMAVPEFTLQGAHARHGSTGHRTLPVHTNGRP
jgi:hypothetical protein